MNFLIIYCKCDGCGTEIGRIESRASLERFKISFWGLRDLVKKLSGVEFPAYKRATKHFCQACADGNLSKYS